MFVTLSNTYLPTLLVITSVIDSSMALILFTLHCSYVESLANNRKLNSRNNNNNNMAILPNDQSGFQNHFCSTQKWFLVDLLHAYESAKKWKKSVEIDLFDIEFEKNIYQLAKELVNKTYKPWIYKAFIIFDPVCREIFAAPFRDRIVHHLIYKYIAETMDKKMYYHSYGARKEKWIHLGVKKTQSFIRSCHAKHKQSYILKIDIKNYFHSIDHNILIETLYSFISSSHLKCLLWDKRLIWICKKVILHDPRMYVRRIWSISDRKYLPKHKSFFTLEDWVWLPLGHLTSQWFANRYLNDLDHFIKHKLKAPWYWRYMDDMVLVHPNKKQLLIRKSDIDKYIQRTRKICLHPKKIYLQNTNKGVVFLWYRIQRDGIHLWPRIIRKRWWKIRSWNHLYKIKQAPDIISVRDTLNTYLWRAQHGKNYKLRKTMYLALHPWYQNKLIPRSNYTSVRLYTRLCTKKHIRYLKHADPFLFIS